MSDPVVLAVGDLTYQLGAGDHRAQIGNTVAAMAATAHDGILLIGDISNDEGTDAQYAVIAEIFAPIKADCYPVPGNHDYGTEDQAAAYFAYFGVKAGTAGKGWYSFDLANDWHIIALNAVHDASVSVLDPVGLDGTSEQGLWLAADLAANAGKHIIAFWHVPVVSAGPSVDERMWKSVGSFWEQLYRAGAEIVLNGHQHVYARFARQDWNGNADANGIREFIVGTGCFNHNVTDSPANLERSSNVTLGFLKLTLGASRYDWEFVHVAPNVVTYVDRGWSPTHGAPSFDPSWLTGSGDAMIPTGDGNRDVYLSAAGDPTTAGYAYLSKLMEFAIRPPLTGLIG